MNTRKKLKIPSLLAATLLICFLSFLIPKAIPAKTWTPGVVRGDFCYYETCGVYQSNDPSARIAVPPYEQNNTAWVRIDVTDVSGSIVRQLYTLHFLNGSEDKFEKETNVNPEYADNLSFSQKGIPLCASNLDPSDPFPTANLAVNDIRVVSCLGAEREAVHFSWNTPEDWGNCYLDRRTGVLIEINRTHTYTNKITGETIEKKDIVKLKETNLWPPNISLTAPQLFTLAILAACEAGMPIAGITWHKHQKKGKEKRKFIGAS